MKHQALGRNSHCGEDNNFTYFKSVSSFESHSNPYILCSFSKMFNIVKVTLRRKSFISLTDAGDYLQNEATLLFKYFNQSNRTERKQ